MNILMHCAYFPPEVGGLESHVYYLCRALAEQGNRVTMVTSLSQPGLAAHEVMDGVEVWRTWMPSRNTVGWAAFGIGSIPRFRALARDADVLHAQDIASVLPAMAARRVRGAPIVTTYHTSHFLKRADSPFWRPVFRSFLEAGDHNLAASTEIAQVGEAIAPGVRVEPLTNGVETGFFRRQAPALPPAEGGRRRLIVPRRLFHKNGVEYFVRALPAIAERVDVEAAVVGDGPERGKLEALAEELGVAGRIRFLGARPNAEMPALLSSAELAVFPSLMEATSVAALECMACELPVAASAVGGLPEIVGDAVGGLFEPANPADLARVVVGLLTGADLRALGVEARRRVVERWSNARLAARHLEIYEDVIRRRRKRS
ncbi:MAG TPA: glycosyltransferase family 4 protein [Longimicrobiales bacterium]|nr:glycosyltransferase family 4 protein [Longimicrobiales bacterium]